MIEEKEKNLPLFIVIPANVHFNKEISDKECRVYGYISALSNAKGYCYADNKYIADVFGIHHKTVQKIVSRFVKLGLLKRYIVYGDDGMVIERRLYPQLPNPVKPREEVDAEKAKKDEEAKNNLHKPHNEGGSEMTPRVGAHRLRNNNISNNNINNYGVVDKSTTEHNKMYSDKNTDNEDTQATESTKKKSKVIKIKEDSVHYRVMKHFNSKDNTNFKCNSKEFVKNIDILLESTYSEEDIINVIEYIKEYNYNEKYWRPSTVFRLSNFERNYEYYEKIAKQKAHTTNVQAPQQLFYYINKNIGKVVCSPNKPNLPDYLIFSTREEAEATL